MSNCCTRRLHVSFCFSSDLYLSCEKLHFDCNHSEFWKYPDQRINVNNKVTGQSDEIIMKRVKAGELAALAELFERYHMKLFNFLLKLTLNKSVSQDLTQNIFYRIIKYRHTYKDDRSFKSWIYQLARNVHFDYCRQQDKLKDRFAKVETFGPEVN